MGDLSAVMVARAVELRWSGGGLVVVRARALVVRGGGKCGGEGEGEGDLSVVAVARAVELRWIGGGEGKGIGGRVAIKWRWWSCGGQRSIGGGGRVAVAVKWRWPWR